MRKLFVLMAVCGLIAMPARSQEKKSGKTYVLKAARMLEEGAIEKVGPLLWKSHAGLRDEYEVSSVELDALVEIAHQVPGVLGARMLGGGFGGSTINLVRNEAVEALRQAVNNQYPSRTGLQANFDTCKAAGGPGNSWVN